MATAGGRKRPTKQKAARSVFFSICVCSACLPGLLSVFLDGKPRESGNSPRESHTSLHPRSLGPLAKEPYSKTAFFRERGINRVWLDFLAQLVLVQSSNAWPGQQAEYDLVCVLVC